MKKITIGDAVVVKLGSQKGEQGIVTTLIITNRKRFYVTFEDGFVTSFFYNQLSKLHSPKIF